MIKNIICVESYIQNERVNYMSNGKRILDIIESIDSSLKVNNYFAAISSSIVLIEICASVEFEKDYSKKRYLKWAEKYLIPLFVDEYKADKYLNKENLYYLRCSLFHQGSTDPTTQEAYYKGEFNRVYDIVPFINNVDNLEVIVSDVQNPPVKEHFVNIEPDVNLPTVFVDVRYLCKKISKASILWLNSKRDSEKFQNKNMNIFSVANVAIKENDNNRLLIFRS